MRVCCFFLSFFLSLTFFFFFNSSNVLGGHGSQHTKKNTNKLNHMSHVFPHHNLFPSLLTRSGCVANPMSRGGHVVCAWQKRLGDRGGLTLGRLRFV